MDKTTRSLVDTIRHITEAGYDENGNWISGAHTKEARYGRDIPWPHGHPNAPKGDVNGIRAPHPWEQGAALPGSRSGKYRPRQDQWVLPSEDDDFVYAGKPRPKFEIPTDLTTGPQFPNPPVTRGDYMPDGNNTPPLIHRIEKNPNDPSHIKRHGPEDFPGEEGGAGAVNLPKNPKNPPNLKYIPDLKPKTPEEKRKQEYDSQKVYRLLKPGQESQAEILPFNTGKKLESFYSESVNRSVNTLKTLLTEITDRSV